MTVEEAVLEHLVADVGVSALVGSRVYQLKLPQKPTLPAVRVQLIDEPVTYHLRGGYTLTRARVQTDAFASEASGGDPYRSALAVAEAIDTALSGQRFTSQGSPPERQITGAFREDRRVMYEADELREVRVLQDYIVWSTSVN